MIKQITIENFKALRFSQPLNIGRVNLLTGANGKGKSSFCQSLLTLSQSWRQGLMRNLIANGEWVRLGGYEDVHNIYALDEPMLYNLVVGDDKEEDFLLEFRQSKASSAIGELSNATVDGKIISDESGANNTANGFADDLTDDVDDAQLSTLSDYPSLMALKQMLYISSERKAAPSKESIQVMDDVYYLAPDGTNVLNVLYQHRDSHVLDEVETLLTRIFKDGSIELKKAGGEMELRLNSVKDDTTFKPENVGFGFSYVLSLITALAIAKEGGTLIVENPEAHLHPSAQAEMMNILIEYSLRKKLQLFVETHSDHVLNTALRAVKNPQIPLTPDDMKVLFFSTIKNEENHTEVKAQNLEITQQGHIMNPPAMFFEQYATDLRALYRSR